MTGYQGAAGYLRPVSSCLFSLSVSLFPLYHSPVLFCINYLLLILDELIIYNFVKYKKDKKKKGLRPSF